MPLLETEGLVLKSYNLAEADRIVVFFTREHGIIRGVAKGARRLKSRFGSTLEPFSTVNLEYFQKEDRELVSIQRIELLHSRFEAASDPALFQTFSYIADLLTSVVPPHDPNETLYRMVKACFDSTAGSPGDLTALRLYFELWLLRLGGYLPNWDVCDICKRTLAATEDANVRADFHLCCLNCRKSRPNEIITRRHREVFYSAQKLDPASFTAFASDKTELVEGVSNILKRILSNVIGKEVASQKSFTVNFSQ
jgi:DNA repair protein RecO (recombination protein O)